LRYLLKDEKNQNLNYVVGCKRTEKDNKYRDTEKEEHPM